jgi:HK97 family phage prohead protease
MSRNFVTFGLQLAEADVDTTRRTISGLMVPWGQSARSQGRRWRFARGGIKWGHLSRVKLLRDHDNASAMGRCVSIEDTDAGLVGTFKVAPGPRGDEALALAADGVLDGLSIGAEWREADFGPDPQDPGGYLVHQAALRECSLTAVPAFDDSRLTSVRASDEGEETGMPDKTTSGAPAKPENQPAPQETPDGTVTPAPGGPATPAPEQVPPNQLPEEQQPKQEGRFSAEQFGAVIAELMKSGALAGGAIGSAGIATPEMRATVNPTAQPAPTALAATFVREPLPYRFHYEGGRSVFAEGRHQFSADVFELINTRGNAPEAEKRINALIAATFDTDTTDAAGVIPKRQAPELWQPQQDYVTPLWDMINSGSTDGTPFELPKYNSSSGLVTAATEGVEPAPGAFTVTTQTVTPTQLWGKVEITRQLIRRGGRPEISGIIWDQMLREYYEDREAAVATFLNTLTAAADIALTAGAGTNAADLITVRDLEGAIALLQFARGGNRFRAFAVHIDLYKVLARVQDGSGRPLYPMINPQNSNGEAANLFGTLNVAGTTAVPSWALGATGVASANSWLFDPAKVRGWASAPERLYWDFGSTIQTANIPQLSHVTMGIYGDLALANLDINGVRQVTYDPVA